MQADNEQLLHQLAETMQALETARGRLVASEAQYAALVAQTAQSEAMGTLASGMAHDLNNALSVILGYTELACKELPHDSAVWHNLQEVLSSSRHAKGLTQRVIDGTPTVASASGQGTTFEGSLPQSQKAMTAQVSSEAPLPRGSECILLVDDEARLVRVGQDILEGLGYTVVAYTSSAEALQAFRTARQRFDLVITDQAMPGMDGLVFVEELRRLQADIPVILCTGFSHTVTAETSRALGINAFLMKPLSLRDLAGTIRQVLEPLEPPPRVASDVRARIVVIDDEAPVRAMLRAILMAEGHTVTVASDGAAGIRCCRATPIDLVITDLLMPEQEGLQTIRVLQREFPAIKIIAVSGGRSTLPDFLGIAKLLGAQRTLHKPFERRELLAMVREVMQRQD